MTRGELLNNLHVERAKLMKLIGDMPEAMATSPRAIGEWSIKDLVSHMIAWEELAVERLELVKSGREQEIRYIDESELDEWNAKAVGVKQGLSWQETLDEFAAVKERLVQAFEGIDEERLLAEAGPVPIYRWLPNFTHAHEEEHLPEIASFLRKKG